VGNANNCRSERPRPDSPRARDIDPDKVYGSKGQSDGDPGQLYGRASLRHPKNANEKKESADQLEDKGRDSVVFAPCGLTQRTIPA
jgi:hypothetical protein